MSNSLGLIEMILVFGIVLLVAGLELMSLRRAKRRAQREADQEAKRSASPSEDRATDSEI